MVDPCKICKDVKEYDVQIGKNKDLIFCPSCAVVLARGLKMLEDKE